MTFLAPQSLSEFAVKLRSFLNQDSTICMYKKNQYRFGRPEEDIFFSQAKSTNASDVMCRVHEGEPCSMYNIWVLVTILRLSIDGPVQSNVF